MPKDTFAVAERVFELYSTGEIKGQTAKQGTLGKKLDLKGSDFKQARGVDVMVLQELLCEVASKGKNISELCESKTAERSAACIHSADRL